MLCIGKCSLWPEKFTCSLCVYLWIRLAFFLHWKNHSLHIIHYTSKFACRHFHWNFHHQPNCIRLERDCRWTKTVYSNKLNVCTFIYLFASVVGWRVLFVLENCKIDREVNVCLVFLASNGTSFMWITTEIIQIFFLSFLWCRHFLSANQCARDFCVSAEWNFGSRVQWCVNQSIKFNLTPTNTQSGQYIHGLEINRASFIGFTLLNFSSIKTIRK